MPIFTGLTQLETTTNPEWCPLYPTQTPTPTPLPLPSPSPLTLSLLHPHPALGLTPFPAPASLNLPAQFQGFHVPLSCR